MLIADGSQPGPDDGGEAGAERCPNEAGEGRISPEGSAAAPAPGHAEEVAEDLFAQSFRANVFIRYHTRRRAWFEGIHRLSNAISAMAGSAVIVSVIGGLPGVTTALAVVTAVFGAINVAYAPAERARLAHDQCRRYCALAAELAVTDPQDRIALRNLSAEFYRIGADNPPPLSVLLLICQNIETEARGYGREHTYRVRRLQRFFANVLSLPPDKLERLPPEE
ncbi:hypothetical protein [Inquilinus sp.]|uniref:hypothetical protein n=1 Tax=Inquilinus sp. TaxID=1932117 RepID=UPI0031DC09C5